MLLGASGRGGGGLDSWAGRGASGAERAMGVAVGGARDQGCFLIVGLNQKKEFKDGCSMYTVLMRGLAGTGVVHIVTAFRLATNSLRPVPKFLR